MLYNICTTYPIHSLFLPYIQIGEYESALVHFKRAVVEGSHTAELNYAHILELEVSVYDTLHNALFV